jgi:N,N-dimethylformamidase beta subunit-like protein
MAAEGTGRALGSEERAGTVMGRSRAGRRRRIGAVLAVLLVLLLVSGDAGLRVAAHGHRLQSARAALLPAMVAENARPGTTGWRLGRRGGEHEIEGYADRTGVLPGEQVRLFVSTSAREFGVTTYRMGWYDGLQGRRVWQSGPLPGRRQAPAQVVAATRTVTTRWTPSVTVDTTGWPPGCYLFKLRASSGGQRYVPLVVRSATTAGRVVLMAAVNTWQAYNEWGGYSLYDGPGGRPDRSRAVSFDRPYDGSGAVKFLAYDRPVVARAERLGLPLAYVTNADVATRPQLLCGARAVISLGHDEYWTRGMQDAVVAARDSGTNVAFLGANAEYWRARYGATPLGPDRLLIVYKSAATDPARGVDDRDVTTRFRDPPAASPENGLVGMRYECFPVNGAYRVEAPDFWAFAGTGVRRGTTFPGLVGGEMDRVYPLPGTPRPLQIVAASDVACNGVRTVAHSTYYTTRSGAGVLSVGTMTWVCTYADACGRTYKVTPAAVAFVRTVTDNVLRAFAQGPAGLRHPAADDLSRFRLPDRNLTGAS